VRTSEFLPPWGKVRMGVLFFVFLAKPAEVAELKKDPPLPLLQKEKCRRKVFDLLYELYKLFNFMN
jgi:hypothetical protein